MKQFVTKDYDNRDVMSTDFVPVGETVYSQRS